MKQLFTLAIVISSALLFAQGGISSITVVPTNPTVDDGVVIYVDVQFSSGDCQLDNQGVGTNGFNIGAYAHHCVGMLTVICETTDTFEIGQLPAGDYTFYFTLTSGFGGPGCSAGIVPDDVGQILFTVTNSVGIQELTSESGFIYPNPTTGIISLKKPLTCQTILSNIEGQKLREFDAGNKELDLSDLPAGIYFLSNEIGRYKFVKN